MHDNETFKNNEKNWYCQSREKPVPTVVNVVMFLNRPVNVEGLFCKRRNRQKHYLYPIRN